LCSTLVSRWLLLVLSVCVCVSGVLGHCNYHPSFNEMIRSSPACSRKKRHRTAKTPQHANKLPVLLTTHLTSYQTRHSHKHGEAQPTGRTHNAQIPLITTSLQTGNEKNHTQHKEYKHHYNHKANAKQPKGTPPSRPDKRNQNTRISWQYV
jgi:hypothetical protein